MSNLQKTSHIADLEADFLGNPQFYWYLEPIRLKRGIAKGATKSPLTK